MVLKEWVYVNCILFYDPVKVLLLFVLELSYIWLPFFSFSSTTDSIVINFSIFSYLPSSFY